MNESLPIAGPGFGATFSADRRYRYVLWRAWDDMFFRPCEGNYVMFVGLNPSTADETKNDPTIRKCIGFATRWGYSRLCMTNLFAFRATDPRVMMGESRPVGDDNDHWLTARARDAAIIVAAWGTKGEFMGRDEEVKKLLPALKCLRKTKANHPEHPLYVPYDAPLIDYPSNA